LENNGVILPKFHSDSYLTLYLFFLVRKDDFRGFLKLKNFCRVGPSVSRVVSIFALLLAERGSATRCRWREYKVVPTGCPTPTACIASRARPDSPGPKPRPPHRRSDSSGPKSSSPPFGKPRRAATSSSVPAAASPLFSSPPRRSPPSRAARVPLTPAVYPIHTSAPPPGELAAPPLLWAPPLLRPVSRPPHSPSFAQVVDSGAAALASCHSAASHPSRSRPHRQMPPSTPTTSRR
jgi:hypothetical protein